nr:histidine phosphatase family protein [Neobacillus sp. Marseille-Q6967]
MEISLIRHGRSLHSGNKRISIKEFITWAEQYDAHGVVEETRYPLLTVEKVNNANMIFSSDLVRSIESARLLNTQVPSSSIPLFREAQLPKFSCNLLGVKLSPNFWVVLLRCLWILGVSRECESYREAKNRSVMAAKLLISNAHKHSRVVLVGHGIFNYMLAKELEKRGWKSSTKTSSKHWSCTTYRKL